MDIVASIIKALFGSKADKDRKQIEPYLEKIKAVYPSIEKLTNDELRAQFNEFIAQCKQDGTFEELTQEFLADEKAAFDELGFRWFFDFDDAGAADGAADDGSASAEDAA